MQQADERRCKVCGKRKNLDCFEEEAWDAKNKNNQEMRTCLKCRSLRERVSLPAPVDISILEKNGKYIEKTYGISLKEYERLYILQNGLCAICHNPETRNLNAFLVVDHDHNTGKVRGLLCGNCNSGLGFFKDSQENLNSAKQYLKIANEYS